MKLDFSPTSFAKIDIFRLNILLLPIFFVENVKLRLFSNSRFFGWFNHLRIGNRFFHFINDFFNRFFGIFLEGNQRDTCMEMAVAKRWNVTWDIH